MSREVQLTQGKTTIVDDADYDWLSTYKWCYQSPGYAATRRDNKIVLMHRLIVGALPGQQVDHADRDKLNNLRSNLRIATPAQNNQNHGKRSDALTSRYKGVGWHGQHKLWRARIKVNSREVHLGLFDSEEDAARAYDAAARQHFGEFARTNFDEART